MDLGLAGTRAYEVEVEPAAGRASGDRSIHLDGTELALTGLGNGASRLSLEISVAGDRARPTHIELTRKDAVWSLTRVRHG